MGLALGPRAARLAHRVLGDGRDAARASSSTSTAAGSTSCSPTTRTRPRRRSPPAGGRSPGPGCTTGWSSSGRRRRRRDAGRCPSRSATSAGWREVARRGRPRRADPLLLRRPLPPAARLLARAPAGGRARAWSASATPAGAWRPATRRRTSRRCASVLRRAGGRLQHGAGAGGRVRVDPRGQPPRRRSATPTCARCSASSGSRTLLDAPAAGAPAEIVALAEQRAEARGAARLRRGRPAARRAARTRLGGARRPDGPELVPAAA